MTRDVFIDPHTGEWRVYVSHGVMLTSLDKTALEEALDRWDLREPPIYVTGCVSDDGAVLWSAGD